MRLHFLQHVWFENPGEILFWAISNQITVTSTQLYLGQKLPEPEEFDILVIMGGPMNIYEEKEYPWLIKEKEFLKKSIEAGKTIVGFCLGAQLIADTLGGSISKNPVKEIGFYPVEFTQDAKSCPALQGVLMDMTVLHWHQDTFQKLPDHTVLLAQSDGCAHQAFSYENRVFGFQFHMETTEEILCDLIKNCENEIQPGPYVQSKEEMSGKMDFLIPMNHWLNLFLDHLVCRLQDTKN